MTASNIRTRHGFSTRFGGVSEGHLGSLNLGSNRGDVREKVFENYRLLGEATGIDVYRMAFTKQVHGNVVRVASEADIHSFGTDVPYQADGVVTNIPGLALICFTADCVPVLLCDEKNGVIGAIHCGWRSSVADILGNAVREMCALGSRPEAICAAIGPSISKCCFEVGAEVIDAADRYLDGELTGLVSKGENGKFFLDLKGANARRLCRLGLREENIAISDECTMCAHEKYWSHRYSKGMRGSQGALIVL